MGIMNFAGRELDMAGCHVMGILNVTPDSFSDGGRYSQLDQALLRARAIVEGGAAFVDVGGESTRPGAAPVSVQEELDRVCPVVEAVARELDVVVSVDTSTPEVMRETARLGAGLINDVRALERDGALKAAAESGLAVCLMHRRAARIPCRMARSTAMWCVTFPFICWSGCGRRKTLAFPLKKYCLIRGSVLVKTWITT